MGKGLLHEPSPSTPKKSPRTSKKPRSLPSSSTDFSAIQETLVALRAELNELRNSGDKDAIAALQAQITELKAAQKPNQEAPPHVPPQEKAGSNFWF